jgi:flavin-binding protein dodecin
MSVYRVTEVIGTSTESWKAAARSAVEIVDSAPSSLCLLWSKVRGGVAEQAAHNAQRRTFGDAADLAITGFDSRRIRRRLARAINVGTEGG